MIIRKKETNIGFADIANGTVFKFNYLPMGECVKTSSTQYLHNRYHTGWKNQTIKEVNKNTQITVIGILERENI